MEANMIAGKRKGSTVIVSCSCGWKGEGATKRMAADLGLKHMLAEHPPADDSLRRIVKGV